MTLNGWLQILVFLALVFAVTKPLGVFMARMFRAREEPSSIRSAADRASALSSHRGG